MLVRVVLNVDRRMGILHYCHGFVALLLGRDGVCHEVSFVELVVEEKYLVILVHHGAQGCPHRCRESRLRPGRRDRLWRFWRPIGRLGS